MAERPRFLQRNTLALVGLISDGHANRATARG